MAYICSIYLIIQLAIIYNVTALPGRGHNQHDEPEHSTQYYWENCQQLYQDLNKDIIAVDRENEPEEKYYQLVLKVNVAYNRGLLERIDGTWSSDSSGKHTERYKLLDCTNELVLPSIRDYRDAIAYLQNNNEANERTSHKSSNNKGVKTAAEDSSTSSKSEFSDSFNDDPVKDLQVDMLEIRLDSEPGEKYYKLVLKVNEAIRRRKIKIVEGTYGSGVRGINTDIYKVIKTNEELRLPSTREVSHAKDFFKITNDDELVKSTKQRRQENTAKLTPLNSKSQYSDEEPDSSSSTDQGRKVNSNTSQGNKEKLTDDEKVAILNRLILQQQKEGRQ